MNPIDRRVALALLGAGAVSACVPAPAVTRNAPDPFEGGIGGTGIVGVLTDFGSLIVNGLRVDLTSSTRFVGPLGSIAADALAPGMALTVTARRGRDDLVARRVEIDTPLTGLLRAGPDGPRINGVRLRAELGALGRLAPGSRLTAHGLWTPTGVTVSRIDAAPDGPDVLSGVATEDGTIGGTPLVTPGTTALAGRYYVAVGRFEDGVFTADDLRPGRFAEALLPLRRLSVEGYLEPIETAPSFRIAGLGHSFARNLSLAPLASRRAIYFGDYDGRFRADAGYVVPESLTARRRILRAGYGAPFAGEVVRTR